MKMSRRRICMYNREASGAAGRCLLGALAAIMIFAACAVPLTAEGADRHGTGTAGDLDRGQSDRTDRTYQEYYEFFRKDPGNPDINFNLGKAAFEAGDFEAAVMAFERVLMARPDAVRVKLEIARCYFRLGSLEAAAQYFEEVLAEDPPRQVREHIEKYLNAVRSSRKEHFLSARVSMGMDFDDNVNTAPTSSSIEIIDLLGNVFPVTVDGAQSDQITTAAAHLNYLYKPLDSALCWKFSGLNYNALYRDVNGLDLTLFDVKAGLCIDGGNFLWDVYGLASHIRQDHEEYLRAYGSGTSLSFILSPRIMLSADARYRKKNYHGLNDRDARTISLTLSPAFASDFGRITFSAGYEHEKADEDVNSYFRLNGILGYQVDLPCSIGAYASYWYQGTEYDEAYPLFGKKRSDDVQYFTLGLSRTLWQSSSRGAGVLLNLGYTYTRSDSNIDLYTYTKNVTSVSATFAF